MAFQTNVLRDGEWVTETVNLDAVLKANSPTASRSMRQPVAKPPECGLLTRTVIQSPVAQWILPARLRSAAFMDVAFIGDHFVQVCELCQDGQLREVTRKNDFGSRIRNAKVIGVAPEANRDESDEHGSSYRRAGANAASSRSDLGGGFKDSDVEDDNDDGDDEYDDEDDDDDCTMSVDGVRFPPSRGWKVSTGKLPPQHILLILESGEFVFLFVRANSDGSFRFHTTRYKPPGNRIVKPGFHAAIDPSSRYMALACTEDLFIIYELESPEKLSQSFVQNNEQLSYVKKSRPRPVQGVIHKMEFMYPRPEDDYHVILLLIIVFKERARLVTYEWETNDNLAEVLADAKRGQLLPLQHQMPLLIIPLTVNSAFFLVSARHISVCNDSLRLPAEFDDFAINVHATSPFYHGRGFPLWTAWTRPYRLPTYNTTRDNIYLAREDGVVMFLEFDKDNILGASVEIGKFECNVGTSFCSLFDQFSDILIMGGDSGPGTIWQIRPRQPNTKIGSVPNWSPVLDFVTTDVFSSCSQHVGAKDTKMVPWQDRPRGTYTTPDRVFVTSGRGLTGAITELRYGLRANIGLDMNYETPVKQAWMFPTMPSGRGGGGGGAGDDEQGLGGEPHLLVSLVDRSTVLHLSSDLTQVSELEEDSTAFDLTSRTVAAARLSRVAVVQVTEQYLVFVSQANSAKHFLADVFQQPGANVVDAHIEGYTIAISTHVGVNFCLHVLQLNASGAVKKIRTIDPRCDISCLRLVTAGGVRCVLAGLLDNGKPSLVLYRVDDIEGSGSRVIDINSDELAKLMLANGEAPQSSSAHRVSAPFEAITSVALFDEEGGEETKTVIIFGTRGGDLGIIVMNAAGMVTAANSEKLGLTAVHVLHLRKYRRRRLALVACDGRLTTMADMTTRTATFQQIEAIWAVDAADTSKGTPYINSAQVLDSKVAIGSSSGSNSKTLQLVAVSQSRVLLAELNFQPGPVHRSLPVRGTPVRLIHSHALDCLIVALKDDQDKPTLQFLDVETGEDLSAPLTTKTNEPTDFIQGLGMTGDRIFGLSEWNYERNGDKWMFLLVATQGGRLLVVSVENRPGRGPDGRRAKIRYRTRYKRSNLGNAVYAAAGWDNNVFYCVGSTVYWDQLAVADKRLSTRCTYELGSFATQLLVVNRRLVAMTEQDSIVVLSLEGGSGEESGDMVLHHADPVSHTASNVIEVGGWPADAEAGGQSIMLLADQSCGVAGLWIPWQQPGKDCEVLFEAVLPASVRKFARGRTRPGWQQARRSIRYGAIPSTLDGAEILGASIDGSLQHFTLLSIPIWRLLRLVQNISAEYEAAGPHYASYTPQPPLANDVEPEKDNDFGMHVDGDLLARCVNMDVVRNMFANPNYAKRLAELLDHIDGGRWVADSSGRGKDKMTTEETDGTDEGSETASLDALPEQDQRSTKRRYAELLYDILEYYLMPVM